MAQELHVDVPVRIDPRVARHLRLLVLVISPQLGLFLRFFLLLLFLFLLLILPGAQRGTMLLEQGLDLLQLWELRVVVLTLL